MRIHHYKTNILAALACTLLLTALGCHPGAVDSGDSFETGESGDTGEAMVGTEWAEVRCVEWDVDHPICLARPEGSADGWAYVTTGCALNALVESGELVPINAWGFDSCANGVTPDNMFAEHRCFWAPLAGISTCWSGDGTWFAADVAACDPAIDDLNLIAPQWPEWSCAGLGTATPDPWAGVACTKDPTGCFAVSGNTQQIVQPTCWLDARPESVPPAC